MYNLPYYKEQNQQIIDEFLEQHPFAFLTGCDSDNKPVATQVPLSVIVRNGRRTLVGHIMKNTDHHKAFLNNPDVLAVFAGPHNYVSATWYSDPRVASTWNYMSVHARGTIRFLGDEGLEQVLRMTSLRFENEDAQSPTVFDNLPSAFKQKVMNAIVGFEIEVDQMEGVFKLSQEKDLESYHSIIEKLQMQGESGRAIAREMEQRKAEVFSKS